MTLDMSISNGRLPDECDFPPSLRKAGRGLNARSKVSSVPTVDEQSRKRFSAMNKDLIPDNLADLVNQSSNVSSDIRQITMQDTRAVDQDSFFNNKQAFPADLTAALCEITNIPPLDFSDMPLLDSTHFNDLGGVPFWPYELLGSPPDTLGQVGELGMNDVLFTGVMDDMSGKTGYDGRSKEGDIGVHMDSF
jgi:hypothetical protein